MTKQRSQSFGQEQPIMKLRPLRSNSSRPPLQPDADYVNQLGLQQAEQMSRIEEQPLDNLGYGKAKVLEAEKSLQAPTKMT